MAGRGRPITKTNGATAAISKRPGWSESTRREASGRVVGAVSRPHAMHAWPTDPRPPQGACATAWASCVLGHAHMT